MAGGEGQAQVLGGNGRKDEVDSPGSEAEGAVQLTAAGPGEHQIKQPSRPTESPMTASPQELPELYEKQCSELGLLRARNTDLLEERDYFETQRGELLQELSDIKRVKNELGAAVARLEKSLDARNHENEQLNELNKDLRQRVHEFAAQVGQGRRELTELSKVNERLLGDLNLATDAVKSRVKTIEVLKVEVQRLVGNELRCQVLEAEADKLRDDLIKAQEYINRLVVQQREMTTDMREAAVTKSVDEKMLPSLEDEMWESESINDRDHTEGQQVSYWSSPADKEQSERPTHTTNSLQTHDPSTSDVGNTAEKPASNMASTQTPEASVEQSASGIWERDQVGLIRSVPSRESDPTVPVEPSINSLYVSPPIAENAPELTKARLMGPCGSLLQMPRSPMAETTLDGSELSPSLRPGKIIDFWNRRRRFSLQGWSVFKPAELRPGIETLDTLKQIVSNLVGQVNAKGSTMQTGENATDVSGQTNEQSSRLTKAEVKRQVDSGATKAYYLSTTWWVLVIYLGLLCWFNQDDRQLWLQANDLTRKAVLASRDERWGGPSWLTRTSFDAENMLGIDRAMLG